MKLFCSVSSKHGFNFINYSSSSDEISMLFLCKAKSPHFIVKKIFTNSEVLEFLDRSSKTHFDCSSVYRLRLNIMKFFTIAQKYYPRF